MVLVTWLHYCHQRLKQHLTASLKCNTKIMNTTTEIISLNTLNVRFKFRQSNSGTSTHHIRLISFEYCERLLASTLPFFSRFLYTLLVVSCVVRHGFSSTNSVPLCICSVLPPSVQCVTAEPVCKFQSDLHEFPTVLWRQAGRQLGRPDCYHSVPAPLMTGSH